MRFFSFDRAYQTYSSSCVAQDLFASKLALQMIKHFGVQLGNVGELGCGSGELYAKLINQGILLDSFKGCDISEKMLQKFKERFEGVEVFCEDFDRFLIQSKRFDLICSSSSLQWSKDFEKTLQNIAQKCQNVALSFLSSATFASLHQFLGTHSPLRSIWEVSQSLQKYFVGEMIISYVDLEFSHSVQILKHLRESGVLGGGVLGYKQAKKLLQYQGKLEYENIIFIGEVR